MTANRVIPYPEFGVFGDIQTTIEFTQVSILLDRITELPLLVLAESNCEPCQQASRGELRTRKISELSFFIAVLRCNIVQEVDYRLSVHHRYVESSPAGDTIPHEDVVGGVAISLVLKEV
jgi:hypothetical protein